MLTKCGTENNNKNKANPYHSTDHFLFSGTRQLFPFTSHDSWTTVESSKGTRDQWRTDVTRCWTKPVRKHGGRRTSGSPAGWDPSLLEPLGYNHVRTNICVRTLYFRSLLKPFRFEGSISNTEPFMGASPLEPSLRRPPTQKPSLSEPLEHLFRTPSSKTIVLEPCKWTPRRASWLEL